VQRAQSNPHINQPARRNDAIPAGDSLVPRAGKRKSNTSMHHAADPQELDARFAGEQGMADANSLNLRLS